MAEMPDACKQHGKPIAVSSRNGFRIPHRAARRHDGSNTGLGGHIYRVWEGKNASEAITAPRERSPAR